MRNITVKHYLNKRVNPVILNEEFLYPVYIQITINRKTTQMRSISLGMFTESEFDKYQKGDDYKGEFINAGKLTKDFFSKEVSRVKKSFEFMVNKYGVSIDKQLLSNMVTYIEPLFLNWTKPVLIKMCWDYQEIIKEKEILYRAFNKEETLVKSIDDIRKSFEVDLKQKIPNDDFLFWKNINSLLRYLGSDSIFIDFAFSCKQEIENTKGLNEKDKFLKQLESILMSEL